MQGMTHQTFSISLRNSWNTSRPAYMKLADGPDDYRLPGTLLKDGITWLSITNKIFVTNNILTGNITKIARIPSYSNLLGLGAVSETVTGRAVIPIFSSRSPLPLFASI